MNIVVQPQTVTVKAEPQTQTVSIEAQSASIDVQENILTVAFSEPIVREIVGGEPYDGSYEVTPSSEEQTLSTTGKLLSRDLKVNPIPSNYGLITWNGVTLTVS